MSKKIEFLSPGDESLNNVELLADALLIVGVPATVEQISPWTANERLMAYDWAMREHLRASDNATRRRPKPSFVAVLAP